MTKKGGRHKFWRMKIDKLWGKVKIFEIIFENRGKSETGWKCIITSGGWTPLDDAHCIFHLFSQNL